MATRRQIRAFRKNAKQSTGPRSPEGKARSSQNARKHGLFARDAVLPDENPEDFLQLIADLEQELEAGSPFERRLVHHIACTEWRMRRLVRLETGALMSQIEEERLCAQRLQAERGEENAPPPADPYQQSTKELAQVSRFEGMASHKSCFFSVDVEKVGTTWGWRRQPGCAAGIGRAAAIPSASTAM